jgi:hypothetical protein
VNAADDWLIADSWQRCDLNLVESCNAVAFLQSAMRPAWDRVLPNAVIARTPSSETVNSLSTVRSYIRIDADDPRARRGSRARTELYSSTHPVGRDSRCPLFSDARQCRRPGLTYSGRFKANVHLHVLCGTVPEIASRNRSSVFSTPYCSIARHVTKYGKPQGVDRETNRKPVRDKSGALGWRRGS